ncbi:SPRY domain-containing SOCS box protein 3-like isoform X2 [Takifugu flavidus]|uniref:SPRY domain-containing SOCS box protein 3-like isoform X2 n=1 Tax=Takifugu flavidus TaxID=433684 RepID=UPI002544BE10|nr:SPRY domain-containing SOCS box protein 3-like isoform X2 [Takifugu flavidus]
MSHSNTEYRNTSVRTAMLRKGRNGRTRHLVWSEVWQDTDALALIQTSEQEEQEGRPMVQMSEREPELQAYLQAPQIACEGAALSSVVPVFGQSFCQCDQQQEDTSGLGLGSECFCGEDDQGFDWEWDNHFKSSGAFLSCGNRKVSFHLDYSSGTAAIRGTKELADGQHFWEVKMTSPVYGTDMMVGIGTSEVNLEKFKYNFGSLLGHDEASWGLSYTGYLQHKGDKVKFSSQFGQGSIIGIHLDTWHGTLTFYKNRRCIGVAATRLQNKKFYPMVCSTAAKSSMKVIRACHTPTTLQYLCCAQLRQMMPPNLDVLRELDVPPGLRTVLQVQLGWVFTLSSSSPDASEQYEDFAKNLQEEPVSSCSLGPIPSTVFNMSPCASPIPTPDQTLCVCVTSRRGCPCTCYCPPTPPSSDYDSCCSEPEDYQSKRCRWT